MKYLYATIAFLLASTPSVLAADYSIKGAAAVVDNVLTGDSKYFAVRREGYVFYGVHDAMELGGYVDNRGGGAKGSVVAKYQLGVNPGAEEGLYAKGYLGPCLISSKDTVLGGRFQFATDLGIGVRDSYSFVGLGYGHISSAGIASPNKGRDFVYMEAGLRF